jgi:hypothetical protein
MQSGAVVEADDVVRNVIFSFRLIGIDASPYPFHFEVQEKAFSDSVKAVL